MIDVIGQDPLFDGAPPIKPPKARPKKVRDKSPIKAKHRVFNLHTDRGGAPLVLAPDNYVERDWDGKETHGVDAPVPKLRKKKTPAP